MVTLEKKGIHFNTIYARNLFFNLVLVLLITLIPFSILTNWIVDRFNKQINQYNTQTARQIQNYIDETVVKQVLNMPNTYFSELDYNYELTYPYKHNISDDSVMIQEISTRLKNINAACGFFDGINLYYTDSNVIFGTQGIGFVNDPSFPKMIHGHEQIVSILKDVQKPTEWLSSVTLLGQVDPSPAVFVKKLPYSASDSHKAVLAVGLNEKFFYQFIGKLNIDKNETLFILAPDGSIILSTDRSQNGMKLTDDKLFRNITGSSSTGMCNGQFLGKPSVISYSKSDYNDWHYVSVTSTGNYYQAVTQIRLLILLSLLFLIPLELVLSAFSTRTACRPLSNILGYIKRGVYGAETEKNEYRLLENTFHGLNEKVVELSGKLEENKPILRHDALLKLLQGNQNKDWEKIQNLVGISFRGDKVLCVILRLFCPSEPALENRLMIDFGLIPILEKLPGMDCKALIDGENRLAAIVNYGTDQKEDDILNRIAAAVKSALKIPFSICAGNGYESSPGKIRLSYTEAEMAYKYAFLRSDQRILQYCPQKRWHECTSILPKTVCRFRESLKAGEQKAVEDGITAVLTDIRRGNYTIDCVRNTLMDMVTVVRLAMIDLNLDETKLFGGDIRMAFEKQPSLDCFEAWFRSICAQILENVCSRRSCMDKKMEEKIRQYISTNLCRDISLESVAEALYISPGYLSKIFKNMFGLNFTDYVTKRKLEEAVRMLRQSSMTVKEISNTLGYHSVQYFIRIFKEEYGYTPKLYQKRMHDKESCIV